MDITLGVDRPTTIASAASTWIGRPLPRVEDERILRGNGSYVDDITIPNVLHAAFVRSAMLKHWVPDAPSRSSRLMLKTGALSIEQFVWVDDAGTIVNPARSVSTSTTPNAIGCKGIGESGCIAAPAAVYNARLDAHLPLTATEVEIPLTSESIWRAMRSLDQKHGNLS